MKTSILKKLYKNNKGAGLIEVLVTLVLVSVMMVSIYSLVTVSLKITADNAYYVEAINLANLKMESIRNMPYDDVGTVSGFPSGTIPQIETEGIYNINNYVLYYDDSYDGSAASDTNSIITDYKIVTIKVSWEGKYSSKSISVFSKIIPRTIETSAGAGLLIISVVDASGLPVQGADVRVVNNVVVPAIDQTSPTNTDGKLYYPAPEALTQSYEITVSKAGYGTDRSSDPSFGLTPVHLKVNEGDKSEELFVIDKLSTLNLKTVSDNTQDNFKISSSTFNSYNVQSSIDSSDNMYFAWEEENGVNSKINLQKTDTSGNTLWAINASTSNSTYQINPDLATTNAGNTFVVWQDNSVTMKLLAKSDKKIKTTQDYLAKKTYLNPSETAFNYFNNKEYINFEPFFFANSTPFTINTPLLFNIDYSLLLENFRIYEAQAATIVSFVSRTEDTQTGRYIDIAKPASVQEDDFLLAYIHHDDASDGPIIPPSGWSTLDDNLNPSGYYSDSRGGIFWKFASASEPSSYSFMLTKNYNEQKSATIRVYRGVNLVFPFDATLQTQSTSYYNQYHTAPSHTVSVDGSMLVVGWGADTTTLGNGGPIFPAYVTNTQSINANHTTVSTADRSVDIADSPTSSVSRDANKSVTRAVMAWSLVLNPEVTPNEVVVSSESSQVASLLKPTTDEIGAKFVFNKLNSGTLNVTDITISENGTIDAQNNLDNVSLYYDIDSSAPYDCASESFGGTETQFGATTTFDSADGQATFNDSVNIDQTNTLCIYIIFDLLDSAAKDDTIELYIANPSTDVVVDSAGTVTPATAVELSGSTVVYAPQEQNQIYYRWRNDDGDEINATWYAGLNTAMSIKKEVPIRLRMSISNNGSVNTGNINYTLEYGEKISTCDNVGSDSSWNDISASGHWEMANTINYLDSDPTTNSSIPDYNTSFIAAEAKDTSNQTSSIDLSSTDFTEIEFSIKANNTASDNEYCFRLTNSGSTSFFTYSEYPEASIIGDHNIYLTYLDTNGNTIWPTPIKKVNDSISSEDQSNPKIAITENFGTATTAVVWVDERNTNKDIYLQIFDTNANELLTNDLRVTNSNSDEYNPEVIFDNNDNIIISWETDEGDKNIYFVKYDIKGNSLFATTSVASTSYEEYNVKTAVDSEDNIYFTYTKEESSILNAYASKFSSTSASVWVERVNFDNDSFDQIHPDIYISNSEIILTWTDDRDTDLNIYTQKMDFNGNIQWSKDFRINSGIDSLDQKESSVLINSLGDYYAAWIDERNSLSEVYGTKFENPGVLSPVSGVDIRVYGTKQLSATPSILEHDSVYTTDGSGEVSISAEWDDPGYTIELPGGSPYTIYMVSPPLPIKLLPDTNQDIEIYVK